MGALLAPTLSIGMTFGNPEGSSDDFATEVNVSRMVRLTSALTSLEAKMFGRLRQAKHDPAILGMILEARTKLASKLLTVMIPGALKQSTGDYGRVGRAEAAQTRKGDGLQAVILSPSDESTPGGLGEAKRNYERCEMNH